MQTAKRGKIQHTIGLRRVKGKGCIFVRGAQSTPQSEDTGVDDCTKQVPYRRGFRGDGGPRGKGKVHGWWCPGAAKNSSAAGVQRQRG